MHVHLAFDGFARLAVRITFDPRHVRFGVEVIFVPTVCGERKRLELAHDLAQQLAVNLVFLGVVSEFGKNRTLSRLQGA